MEPKQETFAAKLESFQQFMIFPAMTVLPLIRPRVGLRRLKGFYLWLPLAVMAYVGYFFSHSHALAYFAGAVALAALWQRRTRWKELRAGEQWHTQSLGASVFEFLPGFPEPEAVPGEAPPQAWRKWPAQVAAFFQTDRRLYRWADPLCLVIGGLIIHHYDPLLGAWLFYVGMALRILEEYIWEKMLDGQLDQYDNLITAERQNEALQELRRGHPKTGADGVAIPQAAPPPPPSGIAEDLREQIAKRQAEAREEQHRRELMAAAEAARKAQAAAEDALAAAERMQQEPATHTHTKETLIINNTQTETIRETVILATEITEQAVLIIQAEGGEGRRVIPGPVPAHMSEREWITAHLLYHPELPYTMEERAAIMAAYEQRQLTGDAAPILLKPSALLQLPAPADDQGQDEVA